jgi:hypothetical protein
VRRLILTDFIQLEVFEVLPPINAIMKAKGKLLCTYPGSVMRVHVDTFMDDAFLQVFFSSLPQMDFVRLDSAPATSSVESVHSGYLFESLKRTLEGNDLALADEDHITKRIGDEVLLDSLGEPSWKPWRRSPLWLVLRVCLQSSIRHTNIYKQFILFFHARLLHTCVGQDFPSELLYEMRAKMTRRLSKLGPSMPNVLYRFVRDTSERTEVLLQKRWTAFQAIGPIGPALQLKTLDFVADLHLSLDNSLKYLAKVLFPSSRGFSQLSFAPPPTPRLNDIRNFVGFGDGELAKAIAENQFISIADFELSVEKHLQSWIATTTNNIDAVEVIASCIQQYFSGAKQLYGANAEDHSIMILTVMDLWVALDRCAVNECPLLKEYSPEIPSGFLHCLLLRRSSALNRASRIEQYLNRRHKEALEVPSILSNGVCDTCFAVKYFRTSKDLQRIYDEINEHAQQQRAKKREELASLEQKSKLLLDKASKMRHEPSLLCKKCRLENQAEALKIGVYEWPLPPSTVGAQLAVFELSPPRVFSAWRDITYMILRDIGLSSVPHSDDQAAGRFDHLFRLRQWAARRRQPLRLIMASTGDSWSNQAVAIPAKESSVLINNVRSFKLYDLVHRSWAIDSFSEANCVALCTPVSPNSSSYSHLHSFVSGTQHTPNDIIAAQADCPDKINLHEFLAFSGLRCGPRLQWLNIARELASPSLSFDREEVHTLITQAAWQLGPLSNGIREWHVDLSIPSFGNALLREMESRLEKIKGNWREEVTVRTIGVLNTFVPHCFLICLSPVLICSRVLASTSDVDVHTLVYALLRESRNLTFRWIGEVSMKADSLEDENSRSSLQQRICMLAMTCMSTFDVCSEHMPSVLVSEEDFSIAMQCAVIVHENASPALSDDTSLDHIRMQSRHRRLLHRLEPNFNQSLGAFRGRARLSHSSAYSDALARLCPGYRLQKFSSWHAHLEPKSRWIFCMTDGGQNVHYDLLTGELLIGGNRFGRLPQEIVKHPTYTGMFGAVSVHKSNTLFTFRPFLIFFQRNFDVAPADIRGMDYMTRFTVSGYQVKLYSCPAFGSA